MSISRLCVLGFCLLSFSALIQAQGLNINVAQMPELLKIKGISKKRAQAILDYREANGPFSDVSELAKIRGLGKKFVKSHADELSVK